MPPPSASSQPQAENDDESEVQTWYVSSIGHESTLYFIYLFELRCRVLESSFMRWKILCIIFVW